MLHRHAISLKVPDDDNTPNSLQQKSELSATYPEQVK